MNAVIRRVFWPGCERIVAWLSAGGVGAWEGTGPGHGTDTGDRLPGQTMGRMSTWNAFWINALPMNMAVLEIGPPGPVECNEDTQLNVGWLGREGRVHGAEFGPEFQFRDTEAPGLPKAPRRM